jgi:RNA polymerase sigma-70 factor (ECF subfamily)
MVVNTGEEYQIRISQGDKAAFDAFFRTYYIQLRNYAFKIVKDISLAEDIVQDTFFNIWVKREQLSGVKNIGSYVRSAVHNESISALRKKIGQGFAIDTLNIYEFEKLYSEILQYQDTILTKELSLKIGEATALLPDQCRTVFILSRSFGFKNREIADQLGISVKAVEKHITKALAHLREHLKDYLPVLIVALLLK